MLQVCLPLQSQRIFELLILPEDTSYLGWVAILVSRSLLCLDFFHGVVVQCCRDQQAIYLLELNAGCSLHVNSMYICQEVGRHGAAVQASDGVQTAQRQHLRRF